MNILTPRVFCDFSHHSIQRRPAADRREVASNFLMQPWSMAFGPVNEASHLAVEVFKRTLAALVAIALLPLTLIGMALRASSNSHTETYKMLAPAKLDKETDSSDLPEQLPSAPPPQIPEALIEEPEEFFDAEEGIQESSRTLTYQSIQATDITSKITVGFSANNQAIHVAAMVNRLLRPFGNDLEANISNKDSALTISIKSDQAPCAKLKSPKSRLPYDFHLEPHDGVYTFKISEKGDGLELNVDSSLILRKVDKKRQEAIINSYPYWTATLPAKAIGIDLQGDTTTSLNRSSEELIFKSFLFFDEKVKATTEPLSEADQENQNLIREYLRVQLDKNGNLARGLASSAISFGEMMVLDGGEVARILKFFTPATGNGEDKDPGRLVWN